LSVPCFLIIGFDIKSRREKQWLTVEKNINSPEGTLITADDFEEEEKVQEDDYVYAT
jgi:hypothetical protein